MASKPSRTLIWGSMMANGFGTPFFLSARKWNCWMKLSRIKRLRKTRTQRYVFPCSLWNAEMPQSSVFPCFILSFPMPLAWYPFWCCSDHSCLLTISLQAEQTSKHTHWRADPCKAEQHPDANREIMLHEIHTLLYISLGAIFKGSHFQTGLHESLPSYGLSHLDSCILPCCQNKLLDRCCLSKLGKPLFSCCNTSTKKNTLYHWAFLCFRYIFNISISYLFRKLIQFLILEMSGILSIPLAKEHSLVATRWMMSPSPMETRLDTEHHTIHSCNCWTDHKNWITERLSNWHIKRKRLKGKQCITCFL